MNINTQKFKILFVCLGNICRSPAAHGTMLQIIKDKKLTEQIEVDSCGTGSYHIGSLPDKRMIQAASQRGIELNHKARRLCKEDFNKFDLIVTMDNRNYGKVLSLGGSKKQVKKMIWFVYDKQGCYEIPDPYYGGEDGFDLVLDLVYDGCIGILQEYGFIE